MNLSHDTAAGSAGLADCPSLVRRAVLDLRPSLWPLTEFLFAVGVTVAGWASMGVLGGLAGVLLIWRKVSCGTQSEWGSQFVGRVLTVNATCKKQNRRVLQFIHDCRRAVLTGRAPPSLLPELAAPISESQEPAVAIAA